MEVINIPINFQLRGISVYKITISKCYFIIEFVQGFNIFINNYRKYDDICDRIELEYLDTCLLSNETVSEILKFLSDGSQMLKKTI